MEKQNVQSMIKNKKLLFLITFLSLLANFVTASKEDSVKINNRSYIVQNTDSIKLINCVDNKIEMPNKYILRCSKGLEIKRRSGGYYILASKDSIYSRYITLRKRFSFKRKKILVNLINPPEPRLTLSHFDLEKENSMELLEFQDKNYIMFKVPWNYNDCDALEYRMEEFEVIINDGLSIKSSSNLIKLTKADKIYSIELKNIKYQVSLCRNNSYGDSILFQRKTP